MTTTENTIWLVASANGNPLHTTEVIGFDAWNAVCAAVHRGYLWAKGYVDWDDGNRVWPFNPNMLVGIKGGEMRPVTEVAAEHYGDAWYDWLGEPLPTASESTVPGVMA